MLWMLTLWNDYQRWRARRALDLACAYYWPNDKCEVHIRHGYRRDPKGRVTAIEITLKPKE